MCDFGYTDEATCTSREPTPRSVLRRNIIRFQAFYGLPQTGKDRIYLSLFHTHLAQNIVCMAFSV